MSYTILTGDRATGPLHLGHFVGSLRQRVELQHQHNQTVMVADQLEIWQANFKKCRAAR